MCRFSISNAPPPQPASPGLEQLLDDDYFCWFDAIADLPDEQVDNYQTEVAVARSCDSSDNGQSNNPSASGGCSDTSSYDLMELFKQQVEQDPAVLMATAHLQAQYGFASFPATSVLEPTMAPAVSAGPGLNTTGFTAPFTAPSGVPAPVLPPVAPALLMPAAPSSYAPLESAHGLNNMAMDVSHTPAAVQTARKAGKHQKTQQEQEAAIERIKQKRRESAQRSRARKNDYMRQLEVENQGLKDEIHRLQSMVQVLQRQTCMQHQQQQAAPQVVL